MTSFITFLAISGVVAFVSASVTQKPSGCKRLTGALSLGDDERYLFFGRDFIQLDNNFTQVLAGDSYEAFRAPYPDAAFIFSADDYAYIFSSEYYFSPWSNFSPVDAEVFGGDVHGEFFKNGLDAAGNVDGVTAFFKGCRFVLAIPGTMGIGPLKMRKGIPCNLDAGLTVGKNLWLMKDDQIYKLNTDDSNPLTMQMDANKIFHLDHIRLCAAGEKESV